MLLQRALALLISDGLYDPWLYARSFGAGAINPDYRALQMPGYVWYSHEVGIKVNAWTINDEDEMVRFLTARADSCPYWRPGDEYITARKQ